jgi:hypothetical protein
MKFRPGKVPFGDPHPGTPVEWEDNAISNAMAWASYRFTPAWCQSKTHWTSRIAQYLFTDCPCCQLFRGLVVGLLVGTVIGILTGLLIM